MAPPAPWQVRFERNDGKVRAQMDGDAAAQRCGHVAEQRQQRMGSGDDPGPQSVQPGRKRRPARFPGKRYGEPDIRLGFAKAQGRGPLCNRAAGAVAEGQIEPGHAPFRVHDVIDDHERRIAHAETRKTDPGARGLCGQQAAQVELLRLFALRCAPNGNKPDRAVNPAPHGGPDTEKFDLLRHDPAAQQLARAQDELQPLRLQQQPAFAIHEPRLGDPEAQQPVPAGPGGFDRLQFHPVAVTRAGEGRLDMRREQGKIYRPLG